MTHAPFVEPVLTPAERASIVAGLVLADRYAAREAERDAEERQRRADEYFAQADEADARYCEREGK